MPNLTDNADETDKADVADEIEANVINEIAAADKVIVINKPAKAEEADANKANEADTDEANAEADVTNELTSEWGRRANKAVEAEDANANDSNEVIESKEAEDANEVNSIMINEVMLGLLTLFLPFSLTKHFAIFAEVKEFFGINNNQFGSFKGGCLSPCSLMIRFICGDENNNQPVSFEK